MLTFDELLQQAVSYSNSQGHNYCVQCADMDELLRQAVEPPLKQW